MNTRRTLIGLVAAGALLLPILPGSAAGASGAAMPSDFNGDGYADLVIGTPETNHKAGSVNVLYGGPKGLTAAGDQRWTQDSPGVLDRSQRKEYFGTAVASGDFDADGYADLAIGVPGQDQDIVDHGAIAVLRGSKDGLTADGDRVFAASILPGGSDLRGVGTSLVAVDVNGDGFVDLATGAPHSAGWMGAVVVLFGTADGLSADDAVRYDRSATGADEEPGFDYLFGARLAGGDIDGDGFGDLVANFLPNEALGEAVVVYGSADGPATAEAELWSQAVPGVEEGLDESGGFGGGLVTADFNGDGFGDLAAGAPGERGPGDPPNETFAGGVNVLYGSADGLTTSGDQLWMQSSAGVPGHDEAFDVFGTSVGASDFDGDGFADLAIGAPGENAVDLSFGKGAVTILYGSAEGLTATGAQRWTQKSPGIPSNPHLNELFGRVLVAHDFGRSGRDDLAIGVPRENVRGTPHAGMVEVLYGKANGLSSKHAQAWTWATPGVAGRLTNDYFGGVLGG